MQARLQTDSVHLLTVVWVGNIILLNKGVLSSETSIVFGYTTEFDLHKSSELYYVYQKKKNRFGYYFLPKFSPTPYIPNIFTVSLLKLKKHRDSTRPDFRFQKKKQRKKTSVIQERRRKKIALVYFERRSPYGCCSSSLNG